MVNNLAFLNAIKIHFQSRGFLFNLVVLTLYGFLAVESRERSWNSTYNLLPTYYLI
jgi:hypothetical protein